MLNGVKIQVAIEQFVSVIITQGVFPMQNARAGILKAMIVFAVMEDWAGN